LGCRLLRRRSASEVESTLFYARFYTTADLWNYSLDEKSGKNNDLNNCEGH
jgi:hypothetical protein